MIKLILNDYWIELKMLAKPRKRADWLLDGWMLLYFSIIFPDMIFEEKLPAGNYRFWGNVFWLIVWVGIGLCRLYPNHLEAA